MRNQIVKRIASVLLAGVMVVSLAACGGNKKTEEKAADDSKKSSKKETEIQVFIAASLNTVMTELAKEYNEDHPEVKITFNADSSGTLLTQIEEGYILIIEIFGFCFCFVFDVFLIAKPLKKGTKIQFILAGSL